MCAVINTPRIERCIPIHGDLDNTLEPESLARLLQNPGGHATLPTVRAADEYHYWPAAAVPLEGRNEAGHIREGTELLQWCLVVQCTLLRQCVLRHARRLLLANGVLDIPFAFRMSGAELRREVKEGGLRELVGVLHASEPHDRGRVVAPRGVVCGHLFRPCLHGGHIP